MGLFSFEITIIVILLPLSAVFGGEVERICGESSRVQINKNLNFSKDADLAKIVSEDNERIIPSTITTDDKLGQVINSLVHKYNLLEMRLAKKNLYLKDLEEIISLTEIGKKALACFQLTTEPNVFKTQVLFKEDLLGSKVNVSSALMEFQVQEDMESKGKYNKIITFDTSINPILALMGYFHEMQHSCSSQDFINNKERGKKLFSQDTPEKALAIFSDILATTFGDELKAYHAQIQFFIELAKNSPGHICSSHYVSGFAGNKTTTQGLHHAGFEKMFEDGTFPRFLANFYVNVGDYPKELVFDGEEFNVNFKNIIEKTMGAFK